MPMVLNIPATVAQHVSASACRQKGYRFESWLKTMSKLKTLKVIPTYTMSGAQQSTWNALAYSSRNSIPYTVRTSKTKVSTPQS